MKANENSHIPNKFDSNNGLNRDFRKQDILT